MSEETANEDATTSGDSGCGSDSVFTLASATDLLTIGSGERSKQKCPASPSKSLYHKRCTSCGGQEDEDLDLGDQKRRRRRRRRDPGKGRLETRLDLVKEDMIADLVRLLGSGTVDTNTVANYFLAQQLLAALATMKEETTQTILIKIEPLLYPKLENKEKEENKLLTKLKKNRTQLIGDIRGHLSEDREGNEAQLRVLASIKAVLTETNEDTMCAITEVAMNVTEDEMLDLSDKILDNIYGKQEEQKC